MTRSPPSAREADGGCADVYPQMKGMCTVNANMNTVGSGGRARRALRCLLLSALLLLLCAAGTACRGIGDSGEAPYDHLVTFDYN